MSKVLVKGAREDMSPGVYYNPLLLHESVPNKENLHLNVSSVVVEAHCESIIEAHKSREIWAMVQGTGTVHSEGEDYPAKAGDVFYFDSFNNHMITNTGDSSLVLTSMWWTVD